MYPVALLSLAAAASPISQMTLAPVYGSIPSAQNHATMCSVSLLFGFTVRAIGGSWQRLRVLESLTVWAFSLPLLQTLLSPFSGSLGPVAGPLVNGFLSCHAILLPTGFVIADFIARYKQTTSLAARVGSTAAYTMIGVVLAFAMYPVLEEKWTGIVQWLPELFKEKFEINPVHLQLALGASYSLLAPSWSVSVFFSEHSHMYVMLALPSLVHTTYFNTHMSVEKVDASLGKFNWTLLDRQWSNTGHISVLENKQAHYRVLRADHSLLGGEWLLTPERASKEGWKVNEPIYAVFEILESVRLLLRHDLDDPTTKNKKVPPPPPVADTSAEEEKALVIGLGIGTAPKALLAHGISTTIVELDPVVHRFATQYFGLPTNHTAVLRDAVKWAEEEAKGKTKMHFDYIIHDVFTGGAEPLELFNTAFLRDLRTLLTPNGVIAINYAGDLSLPLTRLVLRTIHHTFDGQCKIYRDGPAEHNADAEDSKNSQEPSDFSNFVVFCRNKAGPIAFREPTAADFLDSLSRKHYMVPKPEWEVPFPKQSSSVGSDTNVGDLLEPGGESSWASEQVEGAKRHWRIMRNVMPDAVWDLW
ncbi:uncharacterized protein SEPMUDRAFT_69676 [Sphaerulina musiva SO2202]|uniref:S-adenosyl-L-methionine-dependent methyltransferase n=1 Tax=Sphaerulina musiva (strain SO2202) TaxID=692275 RepID=N1QH59_SPHMS|nr:uncharacterized protein SEPMUDRAFT_69676 [Sphaerulina musiva SO2202]EMF10498.1 hypothetical protein SEPMUDRAFT_69676 [Sphaerulina musiva SO2202]